MRYKVLAAVLLVGLVTALLCSKKETTKPPLDSLIGSWKYSNISGHGGCGSEDTYAVYDFKSDGTFHYKRWTDSYGLIKVEAEYDGTWELSGNTLKITIPDQGVFNYEITFTSESVIMKNMDPPYDVKEYKLQTGGS